MYCRLCIASNFYIPCTEDKIPTGEKLAVDNTPFDFREEKVIKENILLFNKKLQMNGNYDHTFVIDGSGFRKGSVCIGDKTGVIIEMYTDCPGVHVYIPSIVFPGKTKNGAKYCEKNAIWLETQAYPDSINHANFPTELLKLVKSIKVQPYIDLVTLILQRRKYYENDF